MKRCSRCGLNKPSDAFYRQRKSRDGLQSRCKTCTEEGFADWEARQPPKPPRLCIVCGAPCGVRYKVCSDSCAKRRKADREREVAAQKRAEEPLPEPRPCANCRVPTLRPKFCSERCQYEHSHPPRICRECGSEYRGRGRYALCAACKPGPPTPKVRYRRVTKTKHVVRVRYRPKARTFVAGQCPMCDKPFVAFAWTGSRYCSTECCDRADRHRHRAKRRALEAGAEKSEPIFRRKVFERDGWTCRICRKPVAQDALVPHPKAATVDHILPLALGGSHTYTNVQTAHFICNSKKSANVVQLSFAA